MHYQITFYKLIVQHFLLGIFSFHVTVKTEWMYYEFKAGNLLLRLSQEEEEEKGEYLVRFHLFTVNTVVSMRTSQKW